MTAMPRVASVTLVSELSFADGMRGRWALVVAPDELQSAVAEELDTEWSCGEPAATVVRVELESDARVLLERCSATSDEVFVVEVRLAVAAIASHLDRTRSVWLCARGGVFVVRQSDEGAFVRAAMNATSALLGRYVHWAPDPALFLEESERVTESK